MKTLSQDNALKSLQAKVDQMLPPVTEIKHLGRAVNRANAAMRKYTGKNYQHFHLVEVDSAKPVLESARHSNKLFQ